MYLMFMPCPYVQVLASDQVEEALFPMLASQDIPIIGAAPSVLEGWLDPIQ
jgi:hypothetical protein